MADTPSFLAGDQFTLPKFLASRGHNVSVHDAVHLQEYITHAVARGSVKDLDEEISRTREGWSTYGYDKCLERARKILKPLFLTVPPPMSFAAAVREKDLDSSPGAPLGFDFGTYRDLLLHFGLGDLETGYDVVSGFLEDFERDVVELALPAHPLYMAFSKMDGYSLKKLTNRRFRSIAAAPLFASLLTVRWFGNVDETFKHLANGAYCQDTKEQYVKLDRIRECYSFGIDFTACDKTLNFDGLKACVVAMGEVGGVPQAVVDLVVSATASAVILSPSGSVFLTLGGNPSGNRLTSGVNTLYALMAVSLTYERIGCMGARYVHCADDSLHGAKDKAEAIRMMELLPDQIYSDFGIEVKVDKFHDADGLYPPGFLPPFLSRVEGLLSRGGTWADVILTPVTPMRMLKSVQWTSSEGCLPTIEQFQGVAVALGAFLLWEHLVPGYQMPTPVRAFYDLCSEKGVSLPDIEVLTANCLRRVSLVT